MPGILGNAHPSIAPYEVYGTAYRPLVIAVGNDGQFAALVSVLGAPDLAADVDYSTNPARVAHREELKVRLESLLAAAGADEWERRLTQAGVPCGPINDVSQAVRLATSLGLDTVVEVDGVPTVANPLTLSQTPATYRSGPPDLPAS